VGHVARVDGKRNAYRFRRERQKERDQWENTYVDRRVILYLREIEWGGIDWIRLAQERDQWRALMKTVVNLRVP
jgi:hypothetical protein